MPERIEKDDIMEAYKFETVILENGIIKLPQISKLANREVEIFIVPKQQDKVATGRDAEAMDRFIKKWTGSLKGVNPDESKLKYISEKYR